MSATAWIAVVVFAVAYALIATEWVFFAGLFVMVGSLVSTGVIEEVSRAATEATEGRLFFASMVLLIHPVRAGGRRRDGGAGGAVPVAALLRVLNYGVPHPSMPE